MASTEKPDDLVFYLGILTGRPFLALKASIPSLMISFAFSTASPSSQFNMGGARFGHAHGGDHPGAVAAGHFHQGRKDTLVVNYNGIQSSGR